MTVITRRQWRARAPRKVSRISKTRGVKVHYVGGRVDPRLTGDHDRCLDLMRQIQGWHMDGNGWSDFAYSYAVCPHGDILTGRGPGVLVAANGPGNNQAHYAVLGMVGATGLVEPTDAMLVGILDAIEILRERGGAGREIKGHRDGYATDCPGTALYGWVRRGAPRPGGAPADPNAWPGRLLEYPPITRGEDVRRWQEAAVRLGYGLAVDGAYGPDSRTVCRNIQRAAGLEDDGIVGQLTWAATVNPPAK
ncbi:peptidoglycan recognition protein family protein [Nonomuraea typhae]|uniref:peptidoglycan recognition protein family protein n=1 Tax=Nonomuraea typhae TaxID=2603600 RepID=UPI0012F7C117|nr:peptidoglycan-binding domain-containing protein [Nonomuraea typhae]